MTSKKYTPNKIARLLLLLLHNKATDQQKAEVEQWFKESDENRLFYESIKSRTYFTEHLQEYMGYDSRQDWLRIKNKFNHKRRRITLRRLSYAAIFILLASIAILLQYNKPTKLSEIQTSTPLANITPGVPKAQLILETGNSINLSTEILTDTIQNENFTNDGHTIHYNNKQNHSQAKPALHTLRIPRGGEYSIVLADNTTVWLNAETELIYPTHFTKDKREVILKGEAYFEVAKDSTHPFIVKVGDMDIRVLGTSFNVSAYPDSKRQTTLITGKVAIDLPQEHIVLHPGQQATETSNGLQIKKVNIANYIHGRQQRFIYEDRLLEDVLQDIERWYDVEVFIANQEINNYHLTANLPKYENIDKVLEIIEYAVGIKFEIKGNTIIVKTDR